MKSTILKAVASAKWRCRQQQIFCDSTRELPSESQYLVLWIWKFRQSLEVQQLPARFQIHADGREKLQLWQVGTTAATWGYAFICKIFTQLSANPFQRKVGQSAWQCKQMIVLHFQSLPMCCMSPSSCPPPPRSPVKVFFTETTQVSHSSFMHLLFSRGEITPLLLILQTLLIMYVISRISTLAITVKNSSLLECKLHPHFHPC